MLYVEDEVLIAMDGEAILRAMGFEDIFIAYTYRDARKAMHAQRFDLALLDINLGNGETSLPIAETLLAQGTRVLFATGYNAAESLVDHLKVTILPKPFDDRSLRAAITATLA